MKVLVTGATGVVGSHLTETLVNEGHTVRALGLPTSNTSLLKKLDVELIHADIRDENAVERAVRDCDYVYHLAAQVYAPGIPKQHYHAVNVEGTRNVARAALKMKVERLIHGSSVGVYGLNKHPQVDETTAPNPNSPYRETKLLGEQVVLSYYQQKGLPVVVARIASVIGARAYAWSELLHAISEKKFRIIGNGDNHYHIVNISNLVDGLQRCAVTENIEGECYILADTAPVKLKQFVALLAQELGVSTFFSRTPVLPVRSFQAIAEATYQMFKIQLPHAHRYDLFLTDRILSITKAQKELGYAPNVLLREGIQQMVSWYWEQKKA